jgi:preprotein translocase subunit SecD
MRRRLIVALSILLTIAFGGLLATLVAGNQPALGLDLQGGISVTQQPLGEKGVDYDDESINLAVERIRDRVDALGVAEPEIIRQGDAIVVNLPGVKDQQEAIELVQVTGQVYLRPVQGCIPGEPDPSASTTTTVPADGSSTTVAPTSTASPGPSRAVTSATTTVPPADTSASPTTTAPADGATTTTAAPVASTPIAPTPVLSDPTQQQVLPLRGGGLCLVGPAGGTGAVFESDATADFVQNGWGVRVSLRDAADGVGVWNQLAAACYSRNSTCPSGQLAIELDGEIVSAPTVNQPSFTTGVDITGQFSEQEARDLARVLKSGSLPVRMETQSVQNVSPTLGKDSLRAALIAGAIGIGLVLLLLVIYYRWLGLVVVAGITVSGSIIYSIISLLSRTQGLALSLAGAAGIIVSVGVTVDSYVVYFERLKDEVRQGRTLRNSAERGFEGAWRTILVADVVSFIGAFTLWYLTVGAVRNFAFFLGLSTIIDLVVSYFFTRPVVLLLARSDWMTRHDVFGVGAPTSAAPTTVAAQGGAS